MSRNKIICGANIQEIGVLDRKAEISRPLLGSEIAAGFPSPAQDYIETSLDLNQQLIMHEAATFFVKVEGDSMEDSGIYAGDILIVDRSLPAIDKKIIIAALEGELTVKQLRIKNGRWYLFPKNKNYQTIEITPDSDFFVWGVVTYAIHKLF
ncbi:MAG: translesion error-prone DNA polymerase V autoproteolytic subunit [Candidatus Cloacimonadota bacterium]|nr:translesion error-prone DNA polymerase V autoproteolytic subunit [Candidatus Cloacimonadota bacterium]